ncbi:MAG: HD domain-containing phosphohydrolase [Pseudomonadota bacterium]
MAQEAQEVDYDYAYEHEVNIGVLQEAHTNGVIMTCRFSENEEIDRLLNTVLSEVRSFTELQSEQIKELNRIGMALSAEKNLGVLLEMIIHQAMRFTNAAGGTIYLRSNDGRQMTFAIVENETLGVKMGGTAGAITWPPLDLFNEDGSENRKMVATLCALTREPVSIEDVYMAEGFDFEQTKEFDSRTGYRSKSMLVIPMENHEGEVTGILQLLNKQDLDAGMAIRFTKYDETTALALASQAAVAITNAKLIRDLKLLLDSFIKSIAAAIDEKSPYTGGHIKRVAKLTKIIAAAVNEDSTDAFRDVSFTDGQLEQLHMAAWMHDVGKITTPEYVVDKATKLEKIFDQIELVKMRFELIKQQEQINCLKERLGCAERGEPGRFNDLDSNIERIFEELDRDCSFLERINAGSEYLDDESVLRVKEIAGRELVCGKKRVSLLTEEEVENLCIRKGTLTPTERQKINSHAAMTLKILKALPFPRKLERVPEIAAAHHETLNGKGYPLGLEGDRISLEARILALADIFEALTAADRPYKKAKSIPETAEILKRMVESGELDGDLVRFFFVKELFLKFAEERDGE